MKFKIGDKVRVVKSRFDNIGKTGKIVEYMGETNLPYSVKKIFMDGYALEPFSEDELELVESVGCLSRKKIRKELREMAAELGTYSGDSLVLAARSAAEKLDQLADKV